MPSSPRRRIVPEPVTAKVPEITAIFWVVKILTTAAGEATSDYFAVHDILLGAVIEVALLAVGLLWQFRVRRYVASAYWFLAYAIASFGTGVADVMHKVLGIPYPGTTVFWAVILAAVFVAWHRSEGTLSIHSIVTTRRECFYWATVIATFALGTALGDLTAYTFGLGFLTSIVLFLVAIVLPGLAWWKLGMNAIAAFWCSYVVTRPLGASISDYLSKPRSVSGLGLGDGPIALLLLALTAACVVYLGIRRPDIQRHPELRPGSHASGSR